MTLAASQEKRRQVAGVRFEWYAMRGSPYGDVRKCVTLWRPQSYNMMWHDVACLLGGDVVPKRGGNKLKYQVEKALKMINYIGQSKKTFRDLGRETGIHSITQMRHALSVGQNFAQWLRKVKGVKDLFQLKRSHYREYVAHLRDSGVTKGHLINVETNLRLLAKGMDKISEEKGMRKRDWVPKQRMIDPKEREKPVDRSYSDEELQAFREKLSEGAKVGFDLQCAFGLRLREAANTKVAHIVERDGRLFWIAVGDKTAINTAQGVTKAGRGREAPCRPEYEDRIRELIQGKRADEYVCPVRYNTLKSAYFRVGLKGSHTMRHTYAREMLWRELQSRGIDERQGKEMLRRIQKNREAGRRKDYGVTRQERPLYQQVVQAIDTVHSYLGHGQGRIDLFEVYMATG